jgi:outer membrane lipoprotein-sorting protein/thiol-disulfide isomerase/thioredoxin
MMKKREGSEMKKHLRVSIIACFVFFGFRTIAGVCQELTPEKVFEFSKQKMSGASDMSAAMSLTKNSMGQETKMDGKIFLKGQLLRVETKVSARNGMMNYDSLMVMDGKIMWTETKAPNGKVQNVTKMDISELKDISKTKPTGAMSGGFGTTAGPLDSALTMGKSFDLKYTGKEILNGEEVYILEGTPKTEYISEMEKRESLMQSVAAMTGGNPDDSIPAGIRIQISTVTGCPLQIEEKAKTGKLIEIIAYKDIKFNTGMRDDIFVYTPPADVQVLDMEKMLKAIGPMMGKTGKAMDELSKTLDEAKADAKSDADELVLKPLFSVESINGRKVQADDLKGKAVLVYFWNTQDSSCQQQFQIFDKMIQKYQGQDIVFMAITDESKETVSNFMQKYNYKMPVFLSKDETIIKSFPVQSTPAALLIGRGKTKGIFILYDGPREVITEKNISETIQNYLEVSPIHDAVVLGDVEKVKTLLEGNPDLVNAKDKNGRTPLHLAMNYNQKDIAEVLLANGADVNAKDSHGWTPLYWAERTNRKDLAEILRQHGGVE